MSTPATTGVVPAIRSEDHRSALIPRCGSALAGAIIVAWILLPLVPLALWSVAGEWRAPMILPSSYSAEGLTALVGTATLRAAAASLLLGLAVAVIATPLGLLGALAARRLPRRQSRAVDIALLAPLAIPPFALVMGINISLLRIGLPAFLGVVLILAVTALPYTAFMFRSALASYDARYEDVARSLGALPRQVVSQVRLPLLTAATARAAFLAFLVGWGDYITTLLVGGGQFTTLPMLLGAAASATGNEQLTAALSLALVIPPLILLSALALPLVPRKAEP